MFRGLLAAVAVVGVLSIGVSPSLRSVDEAPLLHVVAMSRLVGAVVIACLLGLAVALVAGRRADRDRPGGIVAAGLLVLALVGFVGAPALSVPAEEARADDGADLTILSWNTGQDDVDASVILALVDDHRADVIVLPEYFGRLAEGQFGGWAAENGYQLLSAESSTSSVLISDRLGAYTVDTTDAPPWAGFTAVPSDTTSPPIVVVHAEHARLWSSSLWQQHIAWVARACDRPLSIAVGDLNATAQNLPAHGLGRCRDVAERRGETTTGTWPTWLPAAVGAQIDRVMAGSAWTPTRFEVLSGHDRDGTDHRPILARLAAVDDRSAP